MLDFNEVRDNMTAIAYHLHLVPKRLLCQHLSSQFLQARCSTWHPINGSKMVENGF